MNADKLKYISPEKYLPDFQPDATDIKFLQKLNKAIRDMACDDAEIDRCFAETRFPQHFQRLILVLYAPGHKRILVSRSGSAGRIRFSAVLQRLLAHSRCGQLALEPFRLQMDFVLELPSSVDYYALGMENSNDLHFEIGVDGLMFQGADGKQHIIPPGDAYVRSVMTMGQLRDYLNRAYGEDYLRSAKFNRFHSESFISGQESWLRLYRGHPVVGALTKQKVEHAVELAIDHIQRTQEENGKFLYYYDAALDTRRDHEHPKRDPVKNPYYNILRHCGGALTCLYHEKYSRKGKSLDNVCRAIDYLIAQARVQVYGEREGAYIYSEKKSKLGGTGIALYLLAEYQIVTGDDRYREWSDRFAWHLLNQITDSGEFIYYNIYLDKPVTEAENQNYFSFYYPGEAVCGLAKYLHLVDYENRGIFINKLRKALEFLLVVRPVTRAAEYSPLPSDGWLMMGVMELWDFEEMRDQMYSDFVFSDAQKMINQMYKVTDAPYPDYAGAFYYNHGDYPYADGARCEGLLGAYELAVKMANKEKVLEIWQALRLAGWAVMHLVNTEDSIYSAKNPSLALGGIRFKYTRQWFRIDTIQHVASFFAKLLPHWDRAEENHVVKVDQSVVQDSATTPKPSVTKTAPGIKIPEKLHDLNILKPADQFRFLEATEAGKQSSWLYYFPFLYCFSKGHRQTLLWEQIDRSICLYLLRQIEDGFKLLLYLPPFPFNLAALRHAEDRLRQFNSDNICNILWIEEAQYSDFSKLAYSIRFVEDEFIYDTQLIVASNGKQVDRLQKNLKRFSKLPNIEIRNYQLADKESCLNLLGNWRNTLEKEKGIKIGGYGYTNNILKYAVEFDEEILKSQVVVIDGRIRAFTFGGKITSTHGSIFIAISDHAIEGLGYLVRMEFMKANQNLPFFNDSSDAGRKGLSFIKNAFRPVVKNRLYRAKRY